MMLILFEKTSYYIVLGLLLFWLIWAERTLRTPAKNWFQTIPIRHAAVGVLGAVLCSCLAYFAVGYDFRTLSDEANLLSVSQSLFAKKAPMLTTMGYYYYDNFNALVAEVPTRPLLFPLLVSMVHALVGYRPQNIFVLNTMLFGLFLVVLFGWVYTVARRAGDTVNATPTKSERSDEAALLLGLAAQLLVLSVPIVVLSAFSAGFDFMAAISFFAVLLFLQFYLKMPGADRLVLLWLSLLLNAHIRYESFVYLPVVIFVLALNGNIRFDVLKKYKFIYIISFVCLVPIITQRYLQNGNYQNPAGVRPFGFEHFQQNFLDLIKSFFGFDSQLPFNPILSWAVVLGMVVLGFDKARWFLTSIKRLDKKNTFVFTTFLLTATNILVYLFYYFGSASHPSSARFFILVALWFVIGAVYLQRHYARVVTARRFLGTSVLLLLLYQPIGAEERFYNTLLLNREYRREVAFLDQNIFSKEVLIITDRPVQFTTLEYGAVEFHYARNNAAQILEEWRRHLFQKVIIFQRIVYATGTPISEHQLPSAWKLNIQQEIQVSESEYLRISYLE